MTLDVKTISLITEELRESCIGGRIDKIRQPERDIVVLSLRTRESSKKLLISCGTGDARVHFTNAEFENPAAAPNFCMLLRKYITGAVISDIEQVPEDRIVNISLTANNVFGDSRNFVLIAEMMGRNSNIILTDDAGLIIDCIRRVSPDASDRPALPGLKYELPVKSKTPTANIMADDLSSAVLSGISVSKYLDTYYGVRSHKARLSAKSSNLNKTVKNLHERTLRRIAKQKIEFEESKNREYLRECGDILMANLKAVTPGAESVSLDDFYAEGKRTIKLDVRKNAQQNAARYYKEYTKAKNAEKLLAGQIEKGEREAEYLGSVLSIIKLAESEKDIDDIRAELESAGFIKAVKNTGGGQIRSARAKQSAPNIYISPSKYRIIAGKNNLQNEEITFKIANKNDIWFHVQKYHGSHVVLQTSGEKAEESDIEFAARIAAYYSQARGSGKTAVDYGPVKFVKKIHGAGPGMVTYSEYKTIVVNAELPAT